MCTGRTSESISSLGLAAPQPTALPAALPTALPAALPAGLPVRGWLVPSTPYAVYPLC